MMAAERLRGADGSLDTQKVVQANSGMKKTLPRAEGTRQGLGKKHGFYLLVMARCLVPLSTSIYLAGFMACLT